MQSNELRFSPLFTHNGEPVRNNIVIERQDSFATYFRYRFKARHMCFRCDLGFSSVKDLRNHKREHHSY